MRAADSTRRRGGQSMAQDKKNAKVGQSSPPYADSPNVTANGGTAGRRRHRARRKEDKPRQERELMLRCMYHTVPGRVLLKMLSGRRFSALCGRFMDSSLSRPLIRRFVRKNHIDLNEYTATRYRSFNDCFTRRIRAEMRPIPHNPRALIAPCDGRLSAYRISDGLVMPIKQSWYSVSDLLGGDPIAEAYRNGVCLVFRLCVDNYHRYCYIDNGTKGRNVFLPGQLHTVRPIALSRIPVFIRNCREYTVMDTAAFGPVTQIEVGALLVGKILNHDAEARVHRGAEKGMFLYGGSTIVLLLREGAADLPDALFEKTARGEETPVRMGEILGYAHKK